VVLAVLREEGEGVAALRGCVRCDGDRKARGQESPHHASVEPTVRKHGTPQRTPAGRQAPGGPNIQQRTHHKRALGLVRQAVAATFSMGEHKRQRPTLRLLSVHCMHRQQAV